MTTPSRAWLGQYRNVILLALAQACYLATSMTVVTFAGLAGETLAADASFATVPMSLSVISTALTTAPMSLLMQHKSRRFGFRLGIVLGVSGGLLAMYALVASSFLLLCVATMLFGPFQASAQYYRFAAAESVAASDAPKAISTVLIGGLLAALMQPTFIDLFGVWFTGHPYIGAFAFTAAATGMALLPTAFLRPLASGFHVAAEDATPALAARPMSQIMRQSGFIVAVINGALGFAMMTFVMTATPLAMKICGLGAASTSVIQKHVIAMYLPSLFTGYLIARFGVLPILLFGHAMFALAFITALSGIEVMHFSVALIALGLGWNFCFVGGTTLLTRVHTAAEKGRVQGLNEFLVFGTTGLASFAAGLILNLYGWQSVNKTAFAMLVIAAAVTLIWGLTGAYRQTEDGPATESESEDGQHRGRKDNGS